MLIFMGEKGTEFYVGFGEKSEFCFGQQSHITLHVSHLYFEILASVFKSILEPTF